VPGPISDIGPLGPARWLLAEEPLSLLADA